MGALSKCQRPAQNGAERLLALWGLFFVVRRARATSYISPMSAASVAVPGVYRLTYTDWLAFPNDRYRYEVIDGDLLVTPPPAIVHQRVSREIEFALLTFLRANNLGEVLNAPVGVKLDDSNVVEPDLLVVLSHNAHRIGEQVITGPPDLVVEILSPGTARRDLGVKRDTYAQAGVPEYWIVDPESSSIEVLALTSNAYERTGLYRASDVLLSRLLPRFNLNLGAVFPARL